MSKLPPLLIVLIFAILNVSAQTKPTVKPTPKKIIPVKTTPTPIPVKTPTAQTVAKTVVKESTPANLSGLEAEVLAEINKMRTNPADYAKILESYLKSFKGNEATTPDGVEIMTNEGKIPVEEIIAALKQSPVLPAFKALDGLTKAAKDHALDLVKNNKSGHTGSDGSQPMERVEKYGTIFQINENISYFSKTARAVVLTMLIDDGTASRNHRKNLLSQTHKVIGIATGENKAIGNFCVIVFTDKFVEGKSGIKAF